MGARSFLLNSLAAVMVAGVLTPAGAAAQAFACYVPDVGVVYRIKTGDTPTACTSPSHIEFSWSQGMLRVLGGETSVIAEVQGAGTVAAGNDTSLPAGTYQITATAVDHLPAEITAEVLPGITTVLNFALQPSTGLLYVVSRPWGEVFLDDERIGFTIIAARRVAAGTHRLRIVREGYVPVDTTITIGGEQPLRLGPFMLQPRTR